MAPNFCASCLAYCKPDFFHRYIKQVYKKHQQRRNSLMVCEVVHGPSIWLTAAQREKGHGRDSVQIGEQDGEECEAITAAFESILPNFLTYFFS